VLSLGVDVGTGSTRAVVLDPERGVLGRAGAGYPVATPRPGWAEQDPRGWWTAAGAAIRGALRDAGTAASQVGAVAVSGQGAALVLLDADGVPVRPALIHLDQRSAEQADRLAAGPYGAALRAASGNAVGAWNLAAKLLWLRAHEPGTLRRAATVTSAAGYLLRRLTGRCVQSVSDAGISDLFDLAGRCWSARLTELLELPAALLPDLAEATDPLGTLTPEAATDTGLAAGTLVRAGGEDTSSAALAAGVLTAGEAYLSLGTAGVVGVAVPAGSAADPRLLSFPHVRRGLDLLSGSMSSAGAAVTWWSSITGTAPAELLAEAETGADDVTFVPYLAGELHPVNDPAARGVFAGLSLATDRAAMTRALVAGSAAAIAHNLAVAREAGAEPTRLLATGRPTLSRLWMQEVADATGLPVSVTADDGAALGDALIAAAATDSDLAQLAARHRRIVRDYDPAPDRYPAAYARRARIARLYRASADPATPEASDDNEATDDSEEQ
jgi:xylulokinase